MKSGFGQFCPVAVACEVFATRWTPIILRELFSGSEHFNELHRGVPLISRALLAQRLRELERAGVISKEPSATGRGYRYRLTPSGKEFQSVIEGLGNWGQRWTVRVERDNLDAGLLMWNIRRRIALERLPEGRVVTRFNFSGIPAARRGPRTFWLLLERPQVDLCLHDPGYEVDLYVDADLATMARVWLGDVTFDSGIRGRSIRISGNRDLQRAFPSWLMLSKYAAVPRTAGNAIAPHEGLETGPRSNRQPG
jgi:DNA-binding HxlR family transcriptional regulator